MEEDLEQKKTVCIVDDNNDIREIYRMKFQREGFVVVTAKDGEEGLRVIREKRPDIIVLDIEMPVLDGLGVLHTLKKDPELADIPVIVLSNIDNDSLFREVSELGAAQHYLIKALTEPQKVVDIAFEVLADQGEAIS
jgi:CheY-like chemotaxis protein